MSTFRSIRHPMRRLGTIAGLLAASLTLVVWFSFGQTKEPDSAPASPHFNTDVASSRPLIVASSSCAGQACHGRPAPDPLPQSAWETHKDDERWRSSYTIWRAYDPHARAYDVLHEPASVRIAQRLWGANAKAHEERRCLACHSDSTSVALKDAAPPTEGVGCQSCHGDANWIDTHATWPNGPGHSAHAVRNGLRDLSNISVRSEVCAGCHVGAPGSAGIPARDMNHDMIAAGHPRLNFDYATSVRALSPHWVEKDRNFAPPKLHPPGDEFAHWLIGRASTNVASLRLLGDRAKRGPWPELAEFDCYACHHELSPRNRRNSGSLIWNGPPLLESLLDLAANRELSAATTELRAQLLKPTRSASIAEAAERSATQWQQQTDRWEKWPLSPREVAGSFSDFSPRRWVDACHLYYSLLTIDRAHQPSRSPFEDPGISRIRSALQLPRQIQGERFQSPKDFDPDRLPFRDLLRSRAGEN